MVVRFQVGPDFYDHPKSIGLTDAATALWVRAGSYSAAKLLDGFVPEQVLSTLSRTSTEAAAELIARGLWRRSRGGYQFHQWDQRNLTRARVDTDREYERERKQRQRQNARQNGNAQLDGSLVPVAVPGVVPVGQNRDSRASPSGSVSVSVSRSVSKKKPSSALPTDDDPDWAEFWSIYPRKDGKAPARKAWLKAIKTVLPDDIIAGARRYAEHRHGQDRQYTAMPATWLNNERWRDESPQPQTSLDEGWWNA